MAFAVKKVDGRTTFLASACYSRRLSVGRRRPPLLGARGDGRSPEENPFRRVDTLLVSS